MKETNLVFLSKNKFSFEKFSEQLKISRDFDRTEQDNYIAFLENIYDEVLCARGHAKDEFKNKNKKLSNDY